MNPQRKVRRFKMTYHKPLDMWLVTDRYRMIQDPYYFQRFHYRQSALSWIEMSIIKKAEVE